MNNHIWMEVVASNHPSSVSPPQLNVHGGTSRTHRGRIQSPLKMTTNSSSTAVFTTSSPPHTANSSTVPATSNQSTTIAPSSITPSYRMAMNRRPHSKSFSNATDVIRRSYTPPPPASSSSSLMSSGALSHSRSSTPPVMHSANHSIISNGLHPLGRSSHTNSSPSPHGTPMVACHTFSYPQQSAIINGHVNNITTTNTGNTNGNVILVSRPMTPSSSITSTTSNSATVPVTTTSTAHNTHMNHNHKTMFMGSNVTRQSNHSRNSSSGHSSNCSSNCSNSTNNNNNSNTNASQLSCTPSNSPLRRHLPTPPPQMIVPHSTHAYPTGNTGTAQQTSILVHRSSMPSSCTAQSPPGLATMASPSSSVVVFPPSRQIQPTNTSSSTSSISSSLSSSSTVVVANNNSNNGNIQGSDVGSSASSPRYYYSHHVPTSNHHSNMVMMISQPHNHSIHANTSSDMKRTSHTATCPPNPTVNAHVPVTSTAVPITTEINKQESSSGSVAPTTTTTTTTSTANTSMSSPIGIDPATATTLILGMHRHMKPATLLSLLPYAYPAALASLVDILEKDASISTLSPNGIPQDDSKGDTDMNTQECQKDTNSNSAYIHALAQSPIYSMAAALSTALLDSSLRSLKQDETSGQDADSNCASSNKHSIDSTIPSTNKEKARKRRLSKWTCAPDKELKLTGDMLVLYQALLPSVESVERRYRFVRKLQHIFNTEWPNRGAIVHLFGSTLSNLATSYSDVDICLMSSWSGFKNVYTMAEGLRKYGMRNVSCVAGAKVPIVKLWDPEFKLACDINVNHPLSVQNTRMVRAYVSIDPRVRPLTMIIKHWTKRRELNDAAGGGTLSTYTWVNMVIFYLQTRQPPILPVLQQLNRPADADPGYFYENAQQLTGFGYANHESLGALLYGFFKYYALQFDYSRHVVCVRLGRCLTKAEKGWHIGRHERMLCVEEPFTQHRNLGNSADDVSVNGIRDEFRRALLILHQRADLSSMSKRFTFASSLSKEETKDGNVAGHTNTHYSSEVTDNKSPVKSMCNQTGQPVISMGHPTSTNHTTALHDRSLSVTQHAPPGLTLGSSPTSRINFAAAAAATAATPSTFAVFPTYSYHDTTASTNTNPSMMWMMSSMDRTNMPIHQQQQHHTQQQQQQQHYHPPPPGFTTTTTIQSPTNSYLHPPNMSTLSNMTGLHTTSVPSNTSQTSASSSSNHISHSQQPRGRAWTYESVTHGQSNQLGSSGMMSHSSATTTPSSSSSSMVSGPGTHQNYRMDTYTKDRMMSNTSTSNTNTNTTTCNSTCNSKVARSMNEDTSNLSTRLNNTITHGDEALVSVISPSTSPSASSTSSTSVVVVMSNHNRSSSQSTPRKQRTRNNYHQRHRKPKRKSTNSTLNQTSTTSTECTSTHNSLPLTKAMHMYSNNRLLDTEQPTNTNTTTTSMNMSMPLHQQNSTMNHNRRWEQQQQQQQQQQQSTPSNDSSTTSQQYQHQHHMSSNNMMSVPLNDMSSYCSDKNITCTSFIANNNNSNNNNNNSNHTNITTTHRHRSSSASSGSNTAYSHGHSSNSSTISNSNTNTSSNTNIHGTSTTGDGHGRRKYKTRRNHHHYHHHKNNQNNQSHTLVQGVKSMNT